MLRTLFLLAVLVPSTAWADELISIGKTNIVVPPPPSSVPLTEEMQPFFDWSRQLVAYDAIEVLAYLPNYLQVMVREGGMPDRARHYSLRVDRSLRHRTFSAEEFRAWKTELTMRIQEAIDMEYPPLVAELGRTSEKGGSEGKFTVLVDGPFTPDFETENILAHSTVLRVFTEGAPEGIQMVLSRAAVHLGGKIFFLYVYGSANDLWLSRSMVNVWARRIVEANPELATSHDAPEGSFVDLIVEKAAEEAGRGLVIAGMVVGLIGALALLTRRSRKRKELPPSGSQ